MCVQDLRITAGLTLREQFGTFPAGGKALMPSFSRATMVFGNNGENDFELSFRDLGGNERSCVRSAEYANGLVSGLQVYTRESLGPLIYGPLFLTGTEDSLWRVWWYEYDAPTHGAVERSLEG